MAFIHIFFNDQMQYGRQLRSALNKVKEGHRELDDILAVMTMMIDGDGSDQAQFGEIVTRFGFQTGIAAKAAWDELNSTTAKENTNAAVSNVKAARDQAINKLT